MAIKYTEEIYEALKKQYPNAKAALHFSNVFELLIAVILSAQCTDKRVNVVTSELFKKYKTCYDFASLSVEELEPLIHSCGLSGTKAIHIIETAKKLCKNYNGVVPDNREDLMSLSGVGRKTANVVMAVGYNKDAIAVDTHVFRVSNRIGLANAKDVLNTEKQLMDNIPKAKWSEFHHLLIFHGRNTCKAVKPLCEECVIKKYCKTYEGQQQ